MSRPPAWLLFVAAAVVLGVAIVQFVERRPNNQASAALRHQQQVQEEIAARKAELDRDRPGIVARIRALTEAKNYAAAMELASRYYLVRDPEVYALYREAAGAESHRQLIAETRDLLVKECTEERAWHEAQDEIRDFGVSTEAVPKQDVRLERLKTADVASAIQAQLRGDAGAVPLPRLDPNAPGHHDHRFQVRSEYAKELASGAIDEALICAWRLTASTSAASLKGLELVFWLAPEPVGKEVRGQALRYSPPRRMRSGTHVH